MVTDKSAYVGTSNWSGDYFTNTAGVGFVVTPKKTAFNATNTTSAIFEDEIDSNFRYDLAQVFERDWNSSYAFPLDEVIQKYENGEDVPRFLDLTLDEETTTTERSKQ